MLDDTAYDSAKFRKKLEAHGAKVVILIAATGDSRSASISALYKPAVAHRNCVQRLKRIATRYDRLARNYLASVGLAAALVWWILMSLELACRTGLQNLGHQISAFYS
jgi:ATP phosphoribosyltransferase